MAGNLVRRHGTGIADVAAAVESRVPVQALEVYPVGYAHPMRVAHRRA
jgi:hypothetical protein